jgi:UDP-glucuronate decarboxylase
MTIRELAEAVIDLTGSRSVIVQRPLPQDDPKQRCPDIAKAREKLNWQPRVPLREGLARTIAYFDTLLVGHEATSVRHLVAEVA